MQFFVSPHFCPFPEIAISCTSPTSPPKLVQTHSNVDKATFVNEKCCVKSPARLRIYLEKPVLIVWIFVRFARIVVFWSQIVDFLFYSLDCASRRHLFAALAYRCSVIPNPATVAAALLLVPSPRISLLVDGHVGPGFAAAVGLASLVACNRPN